MAQFRSKAMQIGYYLIPNEGLAVIEKHYEDYFKEWILVEAVKYSYECPIRLFDIQDQKSLDRKQFTQTMVRMACENLVDYLEGPIKQNDKRVTSVRRYQDSDEDMLEGIWMRLEPPDTASLVRDVGRYAILSHRWEDDEIVFDDMHKLMSMKNHKPRSFAKFQGFCNAVKEFGCRFMWMDTLCMNNTNSPELEESIRSMFPWYRNSYICIVYLGRTVHRSGLRNDPWFSRGWTLQEILAPTKLRFYFRDWSKLRPGSDVDIDRTRVAGVKSAKMSSFDHLYHIAWYSGVSEDHLTSKLEPSPKLAPLMFHYISERQTSRPEDIAYCLMGLLNVQMPVAYGEGAERAFYRLQVACAQDTSSRSIFAWSGVPSTWNSMLAQSPKNFHHYYRESHIDFAGAFDEDSGIDNSFMFTNSGLRIMMWILAPVKKQYDRKRIDDIDHTELRCTLIEANDTWVLPSKGEVIGEDVVVGIYGFDNTTTYGVLLKRGSSESPHGFTRYGNVEFKKLPPLNAILRRGAKPRWVYVR